MILVLRFVTIRINHSGCVSDTLSRIFMSLFLKIIPWHYMYFNKKRCFESVSFLFLIFRWQTVCWKLPYQISHSHRKLHWKHQQTDHNKLCRAARLFETWCYKSFVTAHRLMHLWSRHKAGSEKTFLTHQDKLWWAAQIWLTYINTEILNEEILFFVLTLLTTKLQCDYWL